MGNQQEFITLRLFDDKLQKASSVTVKVGDKFCDGKNWVWKCMSIERGHFVFEHDVIVEYDYHVPMSERHNPYYVLTENDLKHILLCPVYDWKRTEELTRTVKY